MQHGHCGTGQLHRIEATVPNELNIAGREWISIGKIDFDNIRVLGSLNHKFVAGGNKLLSLSIDGNHVSCRGSADHECVGFSVIRSFPGIDDHFGGLGRRRVGDNRCGV